MNKFEWKGLYLTFSVCGKKFEANIYHNPRRKNPYMLTMNSLGISNNDLKGETEEELRKDAERIILRKLNKRLEEFEAMRELLENGNGGTK